MATRYYDRTLDCGCMISSDGGGGLIPCYSKNCKWEEWSKTPDYKKHLREVKERN
jgi:hypothetical protein